MKAKNYRGKSNKNQIKNSQSQKPIKNKAFSSRRNSAKSPKSKDFENEFVGTVSISSKGTGYVAKNEDDPREKHVIIEPTFLRTALHGDTVKVLLHPKTSRRQRTGEIIEIVKRKKTVFSGTCVFKNGLCTLEPRDRKMYTNIIIPDSKQVGAKDGDKLLVEISDWSDEHTAPVGKIVKILGKTGEHEAEMEAILGEWGFELGFKDDVMADIKKILDEKEYLREAERREDFRNVTTFTIDPYDAKDFDDALSFRELGDDTYEIGVHIADVSFFVERGTALDTEAKKRATSVYLVDRTIPMLPLELSTDLCSLNEGVDRLAMSAIFTMNKKADILSARFAETVIKSNKRFTYENAQEVLDKNEGPFLHELSIMMDISKILRKERAKRGSLMLESEEVKFKLDANKKPIGVFIKAHQDTNHMIEEYMLLANEGVTKWMDQNIEKGLLEKFVYRVHPMPESIKIQKLENFLSGLGYSIKKDKDGLIPSKYLNELVQNADSHPVKDALSTMITRSMAKAYYTTRNIGHYGLAMEEYTHFTSPIRRYPDLMVHRLVRSVLRQDKKVNEIEKTLVPICDESSAREKDAQQAERESIRYKQVEYMSDKIGQIFNGAITGVTEWGIYVEEETTLAEGLIRIAELSVNEQFVFDEKHVCLIGYKSKRKIRIGDKVKIRVDNVDLDKTYIDYTLV